MQNREQDNMLLEDDRLTNLPDHIIHHLLSFLDTRYAIQTCVLSKRWKHYWSRSNSLYLDSRSFNNWMDFRKFVVRVFDFHRRYGLETLHRTRYHGRASLLDSVARHAMFHSLKELDLAVSDLFDSLPEILFRCEELRTFKLGPCKVRRVLHPFAFVTLTTLQLSQVKSCNKLMMQSCDLFSTCLNLENLIIRDCLLHPCNTFTISCPRLVNLVISNLGHLRGNYQKLEISCSSLKSFDFDGIELGLPMFSMARCSTLERVNINVRSSIGWREISDIYEREIGDWKEKHNKELISIAKGFNHVKSIQITKRFSEGTTDMIVYCRGKIILHRSSHDAETEILPITEKRWVKPIRTLWVRGEVSYRSLQSKRARLEEI